MAPPNQVPKLDFSELGATFNQHYSNLCDRINSLLGYSGTIKLGNHVDLGGNRILNLGAPTSPSDALASGIAEQNYSATALQPKLQASGPNSLPTYRMLNSPSQREKSSSWLNSLLSTPPNSNNINPITTTSGGVTTVTIPASIFQMGDGSKRYLPARTDTLTNPEDIAITSFTVSGGVATVVLAVAPTPPFTDTTVVYIAGTGQIDGTFPVESIINSTTFTINVTSGVSGTGGTVSSGGTFYYYLNGSFNKVMLSVLPSSSDSPFNRLGISGDNFQLLAVIRINASGKVQDGTAGGATPTSTANAGSRF